MQKINLYCNLIDILFNYKWLELQIFDVMFIVLIYV